VTAAIEELVDTRFGLPPPRGPEPTVRKDIPMSGHDGWSRHVLILDDEPAIVEILTEVLTDEGCRVTGYAAPPPVEEVARLAPDLIILDLVFGGRNTGLGVLATLRAHPATSATPILVCTALADPSISAAPGQPRPEVQVITKPFDIDALAAAVRCALGSSVSTRPN